MKINYNMAHVTYVLKSLRLFSNSHIKTSKFDSEVLPIVNRSSYLLSQREEDRKRKREREASKTRSLNARSGCSVCRQLADRRSGEAA